MILIDSRDLWLPIGEQMWFMFEFTQLMNMWRKGALFRKKEKIFREDFWRIFTIIEEVSEMAFVSAKGDKMCHVCDNLKHVSLMKIKRAKYLKLNDTAIAIALP